MPTFKRPPHLLLALVMVAITAISSAPFAAESTNGVSCTQTKSSSSSNGYGGTICTERGNFSCTATNSGESCTSPYTGTFECHAEAKGSPICMSSRLACTPNADKISIDCMPTAKSAQ